MPQAGFTPIQNYNSPTAGHIPVNTDLYAGELAINTTDEKLYFKNTGGTVKLLASTAVFTTTGTGSYVLATSPTITGHPTIEGVTSTGATGTGKFVFDAAPTITGHPTIEGVTSTGATGTGKFVFDSAPTITGHPTIEGVTSTGATGTGKFVFDSSPTLSGVTLSDGTANGVVYLNSSKVLTSGSGLVYNSSGNLGLGVTPSGTWGSPALMLGKPGASNPTYPYITSSDTQNLYIGTNSYWDGTNWRYQYNGAITAMQQVIGYSQISWNTAPSGSAGNVISFTPAMTLDSSGNLLVGTTTGSYKITCNGQPGANGYTAWTNYSDERLKENIVDFVSEPVLNKICELRPVSFNYNDKTGFDEETRKRTVSGFIAQEMQQVFPDMVGKTIIGEEEYLDTNLSNLTLYLVKAIQELTARIEKLENK